MALRIQHELEPTATLVAAYTRAKAAKAQGGAIDANALLPEFQEPERPLAQRAIRGALGELDVMVRIPAAAFMMGAPESEESTGDFERPQHPVRIAAFEIGKFPVTFDEYDAFVEATGADRPDDEGWGRGKRPVIGVNWHDAKAYVAWLNSWTGGGFRLPSEAEWEYACRKDTTTRYSFGDDEAHLGEHAWFSENSEEKTHPVGEKRANPFGMHDIHGNAWEWCEDPLHATYKGAPDDSSVWIVGGDTSLRVVRGGSWNDLPRHLRSGYSYWFKPTARTFTIGFRVARSAPGN